MLSRPFVVLWFAMLIAMAGISMVSPLLPIHVQDDLGGPAIAVALSFSGVSIAQILFAPFLGGLADVFGAKRFIVIGFLIFSLGAVGYLFAPTWELVVFFRVLSGVGAAGVFPMSLAYIGRLAPPGFEGRFMGWFSVAQMAGFGIGPLFGGGLRDAFGSDAAFAAMAVMLGGTAIVTFLLLPAEPRPSMRPAARVDVLVSLAPAVEDDSPPSRPETKPSIARLIRRPGVQAATLLVLLVSMGWGSASVWLAVYVINDEGLGTGSALFVGVLLAGRSLLNAVLQPLTGALADRYNRLVLVVIGLVVSGAAQFAVPLVPKDLVDTSFLGAAMTMAPWVLVTLLVAGVAESLAMPAQQAIFVQIGRRVGMGSLMGLNSMGNAVGFLSGSLIGALAKDTWGIASVFHVAGVITVAGAVAFVFLVRRAGDDLSGEGPEAPDAPVGAGARAASPA